MINISPYELKLLELSVEDFYGLWEIIWTFRQLSPDRSESELVSIARDSLKNLFGRGWVRIFSRIGAAGDVTPLQSDEVEDILSECKNWEEPTIDSVQIVIGATPEGERAYHTSKREL